MVRAAPAIVLTGGERAQLQRLVRSRRTSARLSQRARMELLAAHGIHNKVIAQQLEVGRALARALWAIAAGGDRA
jgi:hypothetical protein